MGRPRKPLIERSNVIATALQMINELGADGFNMRDLGKRLGVNPASLYHHFHDKDEILRALADDLLRSARSPRIRQSAGADWMSTVVDAMLRYRAVILAHPNATTMVLTRRSRYRPALMFRQYEDLLSSLCGAGHSTEEAMLCMCALETLASGSALEEAYMGSDIRFEPVDARRYPILHSIAEGAPFNLRANFRRMCELMLKGLAAERQGASQQGGAAPAPVKKRVRAKAPKPRSEASRQGSAEAH